MTPLFEQLGECFLGIGKEFDLVVDVFSATASRDDAVDTFSTVKIFEFAIGFRCCDRQIGDVRRRELRKVTNIGRPRLEAIVNDDVLSRGIELRRRIIRFRFGGWNGRKKGKRTLNQSLN